MTKLKIKKGDSVIVISGRDKGKTGEVLRVLPAESRAIVQGINLAKRHTRPRMGDPGGIVEKELAIHISNIAHIDPQSSKAHPGRLQVSRGRSQGPVRPPLGRSHRQVSRWPRPACRSFTRRPSGRR